MTGTVAAAIAALFPADACSRILAFVDAYGREPHERERERV
jgi:hypothetical protein